ncbi:uncharacterized protein LOC115228211 [Octopus sinensis]|uniref:Uncharacterized protein LOC115228211 n=1 Tax=Octopus sinensis TaxID=2607531 RepID=A0A6P7TR34_9MOLL|nr:uncharacterized protein LOC115228211 [Octopus sinensis]
MSEENELNEKNKKMQDSIELRKFLEKQIEENNYKKQLENQNDEELTNRLINETKLYEQQKAVMKKENQKKTKFMLDRCVEFKKLKTENERQQEDLYEKDIIGMAQLDQNKERNAIAQRKVIN